MTPGSALNHAHRAPGLPSIADSGRAPLPVPVPVEGAAAPGGAVAPETVAAPETPAAPESAAQVGRDPATEPVHTLATYRLLTMRGLGSDEAANLTAYTAGLAIHKAPWTLAQINRLLFLRQMYRSDGWVERERRGE